jgi:hypothetical protein
MSPASGRGDHVIPATGAIRAEARHEPSASSRPTVIPFDRRHLAHGLSLAPSMFVVGCARRSTYRPTLTSDGVKSESFPKLERVLRWDGTDWLIAGYVSDSPSIMKQGKQECHCQEALAGAHASRSGSTANSIYTYDGSTWGKRSRVPGSGSD